MVKRWTWRYFLLLGMLALAACAPSDIGQRFAPPQRSLERDGGTRLTLRASCLPFAPACTLTQLRDAATRILSQRLAGSADVNDPVVRADGLANIVVELPGITSETQIANLTTLLTERGSVAILDTGSQMLPIGTTTAGKTCVTSCESDQSPIVFTGEQIDRTQVNVQNDQQHQAWVVTFGFAGSARQQFADYTASHIGQFLTITANDVVTESAVITTEIDGPGQITGLSQAEAQHLAADLKSGPLPVAVTLISSELAQPSVA